MDDFDDRFEPLTESERAAAQAGDDAPKDEGECIMPVPADAPAKPDIHPALGKPSGRRPYRDADGALLFEVWRFDPPGERKQFSPLSLWRQPSGALRWRWKAVLAPRPLSGMDRLAAKPDASVVICEGEKAADAAARIFLENVCITSPGGSQAASKTDWTPLAGRRVLIWPDADEQGAKYALKVAAILHGQGCDVSIIDAVALASIGSNGGHREPVKGWGAADAVAEWQNLGALRNAAHGLAKGDLTDPEFLCAGGASEGAKDKDEKRPQAVRLIQLASAAALFHTADGNCYADIEINGHRETWPVRSKGFKRWLMRRYYDHEDGGAPNSDAIQTALGMVEAKAHFDAPERVVHVRIGGSAGKLYLDLCDERWRAVEIDADGWRIVERPPVRFRRSAGMLPLPEPIAGGSIGDLRPFLNVKSDEDFTLAVAWISAALRNSGPYPVLALAGEHGSAKSTLATILRALVDPNVAPLRALSREDRDLFIAATNGHVLAFDNVSGLPAWISDTLCRLSTGGGFAVRQLYTDQDEVLFDAMRPMILNSIEDVITRPDLASRALFLTLGAIPEDKRCTAGELLADFERRRPHLLGAFLTMGSHGLKELPQMHLEKLPRMADFALWAAACETHVWPAGTFMKAYAGNLNDAVESVIEADAVATSVRDLIAKEGGEWKGTATELLASLEASASERTTKAKEWPGTPRALSGRLRRAAPLLRKCGIGIQLGARPEHAKPRVITISSDWVGKTPAQPARPAKAETSCSNINHLGPVPNGPIDGPVTQSIGPTGPRSARPNPLKNKDWADRANRADELRTQTDGIPDGPDDPDDGEFTF